MPVGSRNAASVPADNRAAEYVRMSTEHQKYSTANQQFAIRVYAAANGMEVVRTYSDEGKSGLSLRRRDALKSLIDDVESGTADFGTILVYDVSRWGRFPDIDESAFYEHLCTRAGVNVRYCAEPFENDGSPLAAIVKSIKRLMASEYSRELSAKTFAGQRRLIKLGFRHGGHPGYGFRRLLVDQNGAPKGLLSKGQYKNLMTDRVLLVHGPKEETDTVRWIYRTFSADRKSEQEIADLLNARGSKTDFGKIWRGWNVLAILKNEKYIGNITWNRRSFKLQQKWVSNDPTEWVRVENVIEPIVDRQLYEAVQDRMRARSECHFSDEKMLHLLRRLLEEHGHLSSTIIDSADFLPCSRTYHEHFGSLVYAYQAIGFVQRYGNRVKGFQSLRPGIPAASTALQPFLAMG